VTEEDLPAVETPTTLNVSPLDGSAADLQEDTDPPGPVESQPIAASAHMGLSCVGRFRCGSSQKCVASSARCDGAVDCPNQEDELGCVRLSGRRSVLQVQRRGEWRTVCADNWNNSLGLSACKQLGYSRSALVLSSLVSLDTTQPEPKSRTCLSVTASGCLPVMTCPLPVSSECGSRPRYQTRVVGGNLSLPGQFPWQASLHFRGEHMCGGSVISPMWIVTAAHCDLKQCFHPDLLIGSSHLHCGIVYHARYRSRSLDYDIALMRLDQPLTFNGIPICLPNHGEDFQEDTKCWISGWGATEEDGDSVVLRSAVVPLISTRTCNQPEVYAGHISSWMICAGYLEGGVDSCQGDSGGPLACHDPSAWKLVGATSWGEGCAARNRPGVYTRVTTALSWIRKQMEVSAEGGSKVVQRTDRVSSEPSRTMTLQSSAQIHL
uniref:Transmembrane serine protease 3a n=1 Tax=Oryzias latipes TaxID=8090 RepID=A0A3P9IUK0_ORYLA